MAGPGEGGAHPPSFLAHQSPQFQHEFPKLSSGDGQAPATGQKGGSDMQYGPGPSLRPQSEYGCSPELDCSVMPLRAAAGLQFT